MRFDMDKIRVLIADDHAIVRTGLSMLLEAQGGFDVVGEAENGTDAVRLALRLKPDVVVMDLMMPEMDGIAATREIKAKAADAKVLILTTSTVSDDLSRALDAGADGAIMKSAANAELVAAIRDIAAGKRTVSPEISRLISQDPPLPELTPRQKDILASMVRGLTNKDIARELGIRSDGVNQHIMAILEKLGAANRTEAVAIALRKQLLKI